MKYWIIMAFLALAATTATADVLLIDEVRQVEKMELPENGITKAEVEGKFGEPREKHGAVGDPPISHWEYETYSVYFEYDVVLFTVLHPGEVVDNS